MSFAVACMERGVRAEAYGAASPPTFARAMEKIVRGAFVHGALCGLEERGVRVKRGSIPA
jgi:hypothetical protein